MIVAYDYYECSNYIDKKYGYDQRNFAGKGQKGRVDEEVPYLDFWQAWVLKKYEINNGCYFTFSRDDLDYSEMEVPDWIKTIFNHYMDEFAENDEIKFYVWW